MSYCGYIAKIKDLRKHNNADRLQVGQVFGNQIIVSLDVKEGDIGVYFPTDGRLSMEYCEVNNLVRKKDENGVEIGGYLEPEKRHISSLKLRGEFSDGLFMPLESLSTFIDVTKLHEGDTISTIGDKLICEKYIPRRNKGNNNSTNNSPKKKKREFVFFEEHIDTQQLAYNLNEFKTGDICTISLKMHGTSARTACTLKEVECKQSLISRLFKKAPKLKKEYDYVSGSRRVVLNFDNDENKGFYNDNEFRRKWHDFITPKLNKSEQIYYEIVGYIGKDSLIMPECSNKKTNDKEFIKQYGETTKFTYSCSNGENDVYVYRMTTTNEDGDVVEYPTWYAKYRAEQMGLKFVPIFEQFIFTTEEDLLNRVNKYIDGADPIGINHVREGIVVRIENRPKFKVFKSKGIFFKILEGIIKSDDVLDIEEAENVL